MRCGANRPHAKRQGNDMTNPRKGTSFRRAFPTYLVPALAAAAIVASCNFASIPQDTQVSVDGSVPPVPVTGTAVPAAKSGFLPIVIAKATSPADKVKSAVSADHGDAPWICTASGFGQKSRCRARSGKG